MTGRRRRFLPRDRASRLGAVGGAAAVLVCAGAVALWPGSSGYRSLAPACDRSELVVAGGTDVSLNSQRRQLVQDWNARGNPHATLVEVAESTDSQHSQIKAMEESGGCGYDVLVMDNTWTAEFAAAGYLRPLDGIGKRGDFFPAALETGQWHGEQYAVPFNVDVGLLYQREGAQAPATWSDLLDSGIATQLDDYEGLTVNALEAVWNDGGGGLLTGEKRPDEKKLREKVYPALERLASHVQEPRSSHWPLTASRSYDEQKSMETFMLGAPLMRNWPYAFSTLATEPGMRDGPRLRYSVTALPGTTVLGGQNLAVSKYSPHPDAALKLVEFLSGTDSQRLLFSCGGFAPGRYSALGLSPGRHAAADVRVERCSAAKQGLKSGDAGTDAAESEQVELDEAQLTGLAKAVVQALDRAQPRPVTPRYSTFTGTFRGCVQKIFDGPGTDAKTFAEAVERSLDGRTASC
ncbi:extracellular solute-binding protein [Actinomadura sp. WMMA1423]|uniref:extracellular solute-binding protein n=1 Tax=Actinomadura sp. WMMA1423 TaxID=2591108 RepID=UPI00143DCA2C|nr:extracellular solute-binding protein [Actinomadura sp. WMMA1423]